MLKFSEIKELIKLVDQSSLQEIEIENEGSKVSIRKPVKSEQVIVAAQAPVAHVQAAPIAPVAQAQPVAAPAAPVAAAPAVDANLHKITSPMVGTFYSSPSPTSPVFVNVGDKVNAKTVVCIVEAMKLMNEIEAEVKGEIVEILVENGQLVEYGQPLFLVKSE
jgi:acetyl-CoA carboxylase biotin carboxyl carrier protein